MTRMRESSQCSRAILSDPRPCMGRSYQTSQSAHPMQPIRTPSFQMVLTVATNDGTAAPTELVSRAGTVRRNIGGIKRGDCDGGSAECVERSQLAETMHAILDDAALLQVSKIRIMPTGPRHNSGVSRPIPLISILNLDLIATHPLIEPCPSSPRVLLPMSVLPALLCLWLPAPRQP